MSRFDNSVGSTALRHTSRFIGSSRTSPLVAEDVFNELVEQVADRDLLDNTFRTDSTDVRAHPDDDDATWNSDPTAESDDTENEDDEDEEDEEDEDSYYFGYGCLIVSTGPKLPIAAAFTAGARRKPTPSYGRALVSTANYGQR